MSDYTDLAKKVVNLAKGNIKKSPGAYDTKAVVNRVDPTTQKAYVHFYGGVDETPVDLTINCEKGDIVQVRVSGGRAWIVGNQTAPPTDDKAVNILKHTVNNLQTQMEESFKEVEEEIEDIEPGEDKYIIKIVEEYCLASAREIPEGETFDDIKDPDCEWSEEIPEYPEEGDYIWYWKRTVTTYSDYSVDISEPVFAMSIQATVEARIASEVAESAAQSAESIASSALSGVSNISNHFWCDSTGAHIAENAGTISTGASQTISSSGTVMMRNGKLVTSWTGSSSSDAALNFYDCSNASASTNDIIASYSRAGITNYINNKCCMALTSSALSFYNPVAYTPTTNYLEATFGSAGVDLYSGGVKKTAIDTNGMTVYGSDGTTAIAQFLGSEAIIGSIASTNTNIRIDTNGMHYYNGNAKQFDVKAYTIEGSGTTGGSMQATYSSSRYSYITAEAGSSVGSASMTTYGPQGKGYIKIVENSDPYISFYLQTSSGNGTATLKYMNSVYTFEVSKVNATTLNGTHTGYLSSSLFAIQSDTVSVGVSSAGAVEEEFILRKAGGYYPLCIAGLKITTSGAYSRGAYFSTTPDNGTVTVAVRLQATSTGAKSVTIYTLWARSIS